METQFDFNNNSGQQVIKLKLNNNSGEFTRRKNWSQSILESVRDVIHVLGQDNKIIYCSPASSEFLGYKPSELINHLFSEFVHLDDVDMLMRELRTAQATLQTVKVCYRFLRKDGKYTTMETTGQFHKSSFFGSARRIPTEATQSMDTLLDLKLENEKLKKQIQIAKNKQMMREKITITVDNSKPFPTDKDEEEDSFDDYEDLNMTLNPTVYTQGVHPSYDILESVSLFTGLRYDLGERSMGISLGLEDGKLTTVNPDQMLFQPIIVNGTDKPLVRSSDSVDEGRAGKKKRLDSNPKICTDCGTRDAPEWRKGPMGPKTLCNACGLRWSKNKKKLENDVSTGQH